jgi:hypothetical protein
MPKEALMRLQLGSTKAADEFVQELDHQRVDVRQKAAGEILDRVGLTGDSPSVLQQFNLGEKGFVILDGSEENYDELRNKDN